MTPPETPGEGCPPPLRCRDVAETMERIATPWSLNGSKFGTHGWTWGEGPAVYFLSPIGGCAHLYSLVSWLLREDFRCVLIDWDRPQAQSRWTAQTFVDDLIAIGDLHHDEQIHLYGGEFGGLLSLLWAAHQPRRISRVIVQGLVAQRRLSLAERVLAGWYANSSKTLAEIPYHARVQTINHRRWFPPLDLDRWEWFQETTGQIPVSLVVAQARAWHATHLPPALSQVTCPVLFVNTEGMGPATQRDQAVVASQISDSHSTPLHTTGWHPSLTHPHRVAKLIRQFIADPLAFDHHEEPAFFPLSQV
ncbi:alpha/beta fold hydrolase [bacterium]|nr:alpha/beta fold hydrolase [bacterium]